MIPFARTGLSIIALVLTLIGDGNAQTTAEELHKNGYELGSLGQFDAAKVQFEKALTILSNNPNLKRHIKVLEDVNRKTIGADLAISYFKAIAYTSGKQWDQAIDESNKALEAHPEFVEAYINRGNIYFIKAQHDSAISDFDKAIKLRAEDPFVYVLRGDAYNRKGLTDNALADYNKAIEVDAKYPLAYAKRGYIHHVRKREYDIAISDYSKAIDLYSEDPSFYMLRGAAYRLKGQMNESASDLKKAEELNAKLAGTSNGGSKTNSQDSQGNRTIPVTIQETLPQPILSTLEQMKDVSHYTLGKGYLALEPILEILDLIAKRPNVKLILILNGERVTVTQENAPQVLSDFRKRLQVYKIAIEKRGYSKVDGYYKVDANKALEGKEYLDVITLFADSELSRREYILAREIQITQKDLTVQMIMNRDTGGERKNLNFSGLVIGDSIIFRVPNIKLFIYGALSNDTIELKIDLNELKRSRSLEAALLANADPKKAAASDLNRVDYSDWLVTLKRNSTGQPTEQTPSDQLLIVTPDKKFRQVLRQEIR